MVKFNKWLGIANFILWTGLLISVIFLNLNANALKEIAVMSTFVVVIDLLFDMLGNRDERIRREANLKLLCEIEDEFKKLIEEKQGDK